jgi:transcriptional regulator with XRE-family HTH domain
MNRPRSTATTPLGAFLHELRKRAGLTMVEAAKRAGRSVGSCYRAEAGTSADPARTQGWWSISLGPATPLQANNSER